MFEEIKLKKGVMTNPSFVDYRIATAPDINFPLETPYVEVPQDDGPWGARGVGEHPMVPTIAALGNAIYDATGIRLEGPPYLCGKDLPGNAGCRDRKINRFDRIMPDLLFRHFLTLILIMRMIV